MELKAKMPPQDLHTLVLEPARDLFRRHCSLFLDFFPLWMEVFRERTAKFSPFWQAVCNRYLLDEIPQFPKDQDLELGLAPTWKYRHVDLTSESMD